MSQQNLRRSDRVGTTAVHDMQMFFRFPDRLITDSQRPSRVPKIPLHDMYKFSRLRKIASHELRRLLRFPKTDCTSGTLHHDRVLLPNSSFLIPTCRECPDSQTDPFSSAFLPFPLPANGQSGISRKDKNSSSTLKEDGHVYLRPSSRLPPPEFEREEGAAIERDMTRRSQDGYFPGCTRR
jgi:hypothetical protein